MRHRPGRQRWACAVLTATRGTDLTRLKAFVDDGGVRLIRPLSWHTAWRRPALTMTVAPSLACTTMQTHSHGVCARPLSVSAGSRCPLEDLGHQTYGGYHRDGPRACRLVVCKAESAAGWGLHAGLPHHLQAVLQRPAGCPAARRAGAHSGRGLRGLRGLRRQAAARPAGHLAEGAAPQPPSPACVRPQPAGPNAGRQWWTPPSRQALQGCVIVVMRAAAPGALLLGVLPECAAAWATVTWSDGACLPQTLQPRPANLTLLGKRGWRRDLRTCVVLR